jgi:hypothetical protein
MMRCAGALFIIRVRLVDIPDNRTAGVHRQQRTGAQYLRSDRERFETNARAARIGTRACRRSQRVSSSHAS